MIKNQYLLPLITKVLDHLMGAKVYTKLDIQSAYNLIQIKEGNEWKTVFCMQYSHYEYMVMLFGLANTPVMFQTYINYVLKEYLDVFCITFLDDILIYSDLLEEH